MKLAGQVLTALALWSLASPAHGHEDAPRVSGSARAGGRRLRVGAEDPGDGGDGVADRSAAARDLRAPGARTSASGRRTASWSSNGSSATRPAARRSWGSRASQGGFVDVLVHVEDEDGNRLTRVASGALTEIPLSPGSAGGPRPARARRRAHSRRRRPPPVRCRHDPARPRLAPPRRHHHRVHHRALHHPRDDGPRRGARAGPAGRGVHRVVDRLSGVRDPPARRREDARSGEAVDHGVRVRAHARVRLRRGPARHRVGGPRRPDDAAALQPGHRARTDRIRRRGAALCCGPPTGSSTRRRGAPGSIAPPRTAWPPSPASGSSSGSPDSGGEGARSVEDPRGVLDAPRMPPALGPRAGRMRR